MKKAVCHLYVWLLVLGVCAQDKPAAVSSGSKLDKYMEIGAEMAGVDVPYYDESGVRKALLHCGKAKILEGKVADITNLRIDVFEDGKVIMTVFAPQCFTRIAEEDGKKLLLVYSKGDVLIDMEQMSITGRGFRFTSKENRFEILNDSKVLVKKNARGMQGVEL